MSNRPHIHYSCQNIDEDDIAAVTQALRSDFLTQGPAIETFEQAITTYVKAPHTIALSSNTAGLHVALMALGVRCGDTVWTSPLSFVASANAARYVGASIDFVDIEPDTGNICAKILGAKLRDAEKNNTLPKAIIIVHYAGRACDMDAICALKKQYGFILIEDAAHALGADYDNAAPIGSDPRSDAAIFSFHPVKPVTTGEGGAIVTHNSNTADAMRALRSHGITRDAEKFKNPNMPAWYYEQQALGYNYRMCELQAALGASQMKKLSRFIDSRRTLSQRYPKLLKNLPITLPPASDKSGWHLYPIQLQKNRDDVFTKMRAANIGVNVHYMPIHLHPYYQQLGFKAGDFSHAETYFNGLLTIPLHPRLTSDDQEYVANTLREIVQQQ